MRTRVVVVLTGLALLITGCGASSTPPPSVSIAPQPVRPAGAQEITTAPDVATAQCTDAEASLRPGPLPSPGAMPAGFDDGRHPRARTAHRRRRPEHRPVRLPRSRFRPAGGFRHRPRPRDRARASSATPTASSCRWSRPANGSRRCESGQVDLIVRTYSITCERKRTVDFSTTYFYAHQKILARKRLANPFCCRPFRQAGLLGVGHDVAEAGVRPGTEADPDRRHQLDRLPADVAAGTGRRHQHRRRRAERTCRAKTLTSTCRRQPGHRALRVGVKKGNDDLVRFVNGALEDIRADGTWERLYDRWLTSLGPSPGPPTARYQD